MAVAVTGAGAEIMAKNRAGAGAKNKKFWLHITGRNKEVSANLL